MPGPWKEKLCQPVCESAGSYWSSIRDMSLPSTRHLVGYSGERTFPFEPVIFRQEIHSVHDLASAAQFLGGVHSSPRVWGIWSDKRLGTVNWLCQTWCCNPTHGCRVSLSEQSLVVNHTFCITEPHQSLWVPESMDKTATRFSSLIVYRRVGSAGCETPHV